MGIIPIRTLMESNERKSSVESRRICFSLQITLCSISILSRFIFMISYVYYFAFNSFFNSLLIAVISYFIFSLGPFVSIFVFYSFNNTFRDELNKKLRFWRNYSLIIHGSRQSGVKNILDFFKIFKIDVSLLLIYFELNLFLTNSKFFHKLRVEICLVRNYSLLTTRTSSKGQLIEIFFS